MPRGRLTAAGRVGLAVTAAVTAGVLAMSVMAYFSVLSRLTASTEEVLLAELGRFAETEGLRSADSATLAEAVRGYLSGYERSGGASVVFIVRLSDGSILSNADVRLELAEGNAQILRGSDRGLATVSLDGTDWRVAYSPIGDGGGATLGTIETAQSLDEVRLVARSVTWALLASGMAVVLLGASTSAWVARASLRPLARAAADVSHIGLGTLGRRVAEPGTTDEIGVMTATLNSMLDRMEAAFGEQERFVSDASHELRTPLAIIRGHLDVAVDVRVEPAEREDSLALARGEIERMQRLVDDLLTLARLESGPEREHQPLEIGLTAWEAVQHVEPLGSQTIEFLCTGHHWVLGDPDRLLQALLNLLVNAQQHTPPEGKIRLGCERHPRSVILWVEDTGEGIPESERGRVFDRFHRVRAKSADGGSGLGLAITRRIVETHGGSNDVGDAERDGARFRVRLPRIEPPP